MTSLFPKLAKEERERLETEAVPVAPTAMRAVLVSERFSDPDWIFERKLDGERCLASRDADRVALRSRNGRDLDPSSDDFEILRRAALRLRDALEEDGLPPFVKTTGSRGLHVVAPIRRGPSFETVRDVASRIARRLADAHPEELTTEMRKDDRGDRVFLDVLRNARGQTVAAPYALRARPGAPVATPLRWDEVEDGSATPRKYTIANVFLRLGQIEDPWAGIGRHARSLPRASLR